jgi:hypothetical protein
MPKFALLSTSNTKTLKGEDKGYITFILHLAPSKLSGFNVCAAASPECIVLCLNTAGHGGMFKKGTNTNHVQEARIRRTRLYFTDREFFLKDLVKDIEKAITYADSIGFIPCFRLNGTSDLLWENIAVVRNGVEYPNVMTAFPTTMFYDYRKVNKIPNIPNYHITFSRSEINEDIAINVLHAGFNVAVVFEKTLPPTWNGFTVVSGDNDDLRFLDPVNVVVGLTAKGRAKKLIGGFVVAS